MNIFSSGNFGAWRTPGGDSPLVATRTTDSGDHTLTIRPGADVGDLAVILGDLPADAVFAEHFGDVDLVLIFRQDPGLSAVVPANANPSTGPAAASVPRP
ncbi:hypothetical protein ThrDRAFT_03761 [Frankia casuarinae]|uniref:Uncharacterized protein n=1 Tax=Frankia casuarinae (strain DSM 45818 / CECT 9043 / HFP020203 / CcI3) TaxID=106370 RepID=Q2JE77_FRACC|nr:MULTISPECIES: hypothetical protein [Frankia]ABD10415.1 hypothetical protein Francci3_1032 [Frankia casuarinae]ETA00426.1 hypothetical protein CcI6DRAFT_04181 [Frankia sp. CcI6]EYT90604.1 hypothetical protein ThrDRAFT_03761 [Frankia casuarinae]KEZ34910.1 Frankia-40 domain [Frankia sp. CeD]KFB03024.1 Frankia-40 domain [Frankia sp. Allo2]